MPLLVLAGLRHAGSGGQLLRNSCLAILKQRNKKKGRRNKEGEADSFVDDRAFPCNSDLDDTTEESLWPSQ